MLRERAGFYHKNLLKFADGLVLTNLPNFFAGSTVSGRGTIDISIQTESPI